MPNDSLWKKTIMSRATSSLYLRLLCRFEPDGVLDFLKINDSYDIDECLEYCSMHNLGKACAYLLERKGDLRGAYNLYMREIKSINDQLATLDFAEPSLLGQAEEVCRLAISLCARSCQGESKESLSQKEEVRGSLWYELVMTYVKAFLNAKPGLPPKGRKPLLLYVQMVLDEATSYVDTQLMSVNIIEEFEELPINKLQMIAQVLLGFSEFELNTSKLAREISKKESVETIWQSYVSLTRSGRQL